MASTDAVALVPLPVRQVRDLVRGAGARPPGWHPEYPTGDTLDAASMLLAAYDAVGSVPPDPVWWLFGIVADGQVVGDAGFHAPPADAGPVEVEIGYQVVPAWRGRGLATGACRQLLAYAWAHGADVVRAEAAPENRASRGVLRSCGFELTSRGDFAVSAPPGGVAWTA